MIVRHDKLNPLIKTGLAPIKTFPASRENVVPGMFFYFYDTLVPVDSV